MGKQPCYDTSRAFGAAADHSAQSTYSTKRLFDIANEDF
jgi:hypothetical protein